MALRETAPSGGIRNAKEQYVTNAKNSQRCAPTVFVRMPESEGIKKSQLVKAMNRLLDNDVIGIGSVIRLIP